MAPSTKRRAKPKQDEIPESIFDALNAHNPGADEVSGAPARKATDKAEGPSIEELQAQIAEANRRIEAAERANMALTTAAPVVPAQPQEPKLNMDGLPDPIENHQAYATALAKRVAEYNTETQKFYREQERVRQASQPDFDGLWKEFSHSYSDYASDSEGMEFVVNKIKRDAERKGLDVNKYMFQNSDRFFRDITSAYDKRFGKPGEEADDEPTPAPRRKAASEPLEDEEANRTGGIFGGTDGAGSGRKPAGPPAGDMIKDLQDLQRKSGYY